MKLFKLYWILFFMMNVQHQGHGICPHKTTILHFCLVYKVIVLMWPVMTYSFLENLAKDLYWKIFNFFYFWPTYNSLGTEFHN